ncbi:MAG: phosphoribosylformylglycinamidine synthase subunit PurS [Chloroflexi bacterium]|nr:phosphoribosylformylglycinamidine synthase subunit PurS [Chloroflexota bacterium]
MSTFRFAVSVMPREGILDPQGRAVETSLPHLDVTNVHGVRVGRRVELSVDAPDAAAARVVVERLAGELFANPLLEDWSIEALGVTQGSAASAEGAAGSAGSAAPSDSAVPSGTVGA